MVDRWEFIQISFVEKILLPNCPLPKRQATKTHLSSKKKSSPGWFKAVHQTSSPIVGGHLTSPLEFGSRFHSPSQKRSRLESPGLEFFRTPKKPEFFFFSKRCPFSAASPPEPSVEGGRGLGKGNQGGFFFGWFSKADLWSKRWPHLGGGNSNIFSFHPDPWGDVIQFDEHIFLVGLVQPPTSHDLERKEIHTTMKW